MKPHLLLKEIIVKNGSGLCFSRSRCKSIISDTFKNSHGREKNLLYTVLDDGIVSDLINSPKELKINASRYIDKLVQEQGIEIIYAQWAVYSWAFSLGLITDSVLLKIEEKLSNKGNERQINNNTVVVRPPPDNNITNVYQSGVIPPTMVSVSLPVSKPFAIPNDISVRTLIGHTNGVHSVTISPDCRTLASGSSDHSVKIWDILSGECKKTLKGHTGFLAFVNVVVFSPDGRHTVSGADDYMLKIWDVSSGECIKTLKGHNGKVYSVAISPDGHFIVSGSADKTLKIWDFSTGECIKTLKGHSNAVNTIAISPDGLLAVSGSKDKFPKDGAA